MEMGGAAVPAPEFISGAERPNTPAKKDEIEHMLAHLEDELSKAGFFRSPDQRPTILRNIRNFFFRAAPTEQEVRTLRGIISSLTGKRTWK